MVESEKRKRSPPPPFLAPYASLDGLPDNVILLILSYLNVVSLVLLSRVCRRFHRLSRDVSAWESVELTRASMGRRLNSVTLKRVIRTHLPLSLRRVTLEETNPRGNAVITEALIELLFGCCPRMESIALLHCDMKKVLWFF